jgi:hypothetical protein
MTQPVKFGLNVDPNTGGLAIAERITAIADASGLELVGVQDHQIITSAARDAGRDPAAITRLYNVMGLITPQDRDAFDGPVERWAETLATLHTESQMNAFVFWPTGDRERQSRLFAEQVVPAVRESISSGAG